MTTPEPQIEQHRHDAEVPTMTLAEAKTAPRDARPAEDVPTAPLDSEGLEAESQSHPHEAQPSSETPLFTDDVLAALRTRWDGVQAGFVDDPRDCVQKADGLVTDVVGKLTAGFTQARTRLEGQWSRGEEASTEDLRVALTRYRDFFERLLAV
jgi:hypothetical protein